MSVVMKKQVVKTAAPISGESAKKPTKEKVSKTSGTHPSWAVMIADAVKLLNERGGSSIQAIKKTIAANYTVDMDKITTYLMRRGVKAAISAGTLVQAKGQGLNGSFKLGTGVGKPTNKKAGKIAIKKPTATKAKKEAAPKKVPVKTVEVKKTTVAKKAPEKAVAAMPAPAKPVVAKKTELEPKNTATASSTQEKKEVKAKPVAAARMKAAIMPKVAKSQKATKAPKPKTTKKIPAKPKAKPAAAPK